MKCHIIFVLNWRGEKGRENWAARANYFDSWWWAGRLRSGLEEEGQEHGGGKGGGITD